MDKALQKVRSVLNLQFIYKFSRVFVLVFMAGLLAIVAPGFWRVSNALNILRQASMVALVALGQTIAIIVGGIDLSVGQVGTFASIVIGWTLLRMGWPDWAGVLAGLSFGIFMGLMNGLMVAVVGLPAFIATYGTLWVSVGLTVIIMQGAVIYGFSPGLRFLGIGKPLGIPMPIYIFAICLALTWFILHRTTFGRNIYAVGANAKAAAMSGINVQKTRIMAYVLSGFFAGLGGLVHLALLNTAESYLMEGLLILSIGSVVVGGTSMAGGEGSIIGTAIGAIILNLVTNGMNLLGIHSSWQQPVQGSIVLAAVYFDHITRQRLARQEQETGS